MSWEIDVKVKYGIRYATYLDRDRVSCGQVIPKEPPLSGCHLGKEPPLTVCVYMCVCMCVCVCVGMCFLCVCCVCVGMCVCVCVYVCICHQKTAVVRHLKDS